MDKIKKILKYLAIALFSLFAILGFFVTVCFAFDLLGLGSWNGYWIKVEIRDGNTPVNRGPAAQIDPSTGQIRPTPLEELALLYPINPENNQLLLGASHNVFVGKVLEQSGNKETEIGPRTQYTVQVIDNIKGDLNSTVVLDMLGGYQDGKLVVVEDNSPEAFLLKPGSTYLFATRYNEQENWHTLIAHPNARKVLSKDNSLPVQALRVLAEKDEKVKSLEAAYPNEVLLDADVAHQNTRNSFQSLPPEAKAAAVARADAARAELGVHAQGL